MNSEKLSPNGITVFVVLKEDVASVGDLGEIYGCF